MSHKAPKLTVETSLLVLLSFLWGGSFTLTEVALDTVPPASIVAARLTIGALLLVMTALWLRLRFPDTATTWTALLIQGILQSALPFTLISWGQTRIDSGLAGLLNITPPLFVFLIGLILLRDRANLGRRLAGTVIGFVGVAATLGPAALADDQGSVLGQLAITGASLSYAVAALFARRFSEQPPILTAACSMSMAAAIMVPVAIFTDQPQNLSPSAASFGAILGLGFFSTAIAMVIYFRLVRTLGPLGVTTGSYLRAGFSMLLGAFILGEALTSAQMLGFVLILLGVAVTTGQIRYPFRARHAQ